MTDLNELRSNIDEIDNKLVKLIEDRINIILDIAKYKKNNNIEIQDKKRENEIINRLSKKLENKDFKNVLIEIMDSIFRNSKNVQNEVDKDFFD